MAVTFIDLSPATHTDYAGYVCIFTMQHMKNTSPFKFLKYLFPEEIFSQRNGSWIIMFLKLLGFFFHLFDLKVRGYLIQFFSRGFY